MFGDTRTPKKPRKYGNILETYYLCKYETQKHSKSFGTSVLPSVLFDSGDSCNLLMGGYANKEIIGQALSKLNERGNYWPESIHVDQK